MTTPSPIPLQPDLVYGPVDSRRLGRSLGVNLLPGHSKACNFDCVYCQYDDVSGEGARMPSPEEVLRAVEEVLLREPCEAITLAGNGEPTLHPEFAVIVSGLKALRDRVAPEALLCLLTNGTRLGDPSVKGALASIDRPLIKLDAGDEATFRSVNRPRGLDFGSLLATVASLPKVELQSMFMEGAVSNAAPEQIASWLEAVRRVRPAHVQVTTVDRGTVTPGILPLPAARLEAIAAGLRAEGIPAEAFPCRDEERFHVTNG